MKYFILLTAILCFVFAAASFYLPAYAGIALGVILGAIGFWILLLLWIAIPEDM